MELGWPGVDLSSESMGFDTLKTQSIQYSFIKRIEDDFDLIYNDDGSGEMADVVAIKKNEDNIEIHLFHLKYARGGTISGRIDNFYEVCGQAQKSLKWKHCERRRLFDHLFKRLKNKKRIVKGNVDILEDIQTKALWDIEVNFKISVVQPGISKEKITDDIKSLLATTSYYLKATGDVDFTIYISD